MISEALLKYHREQAGRAAELYINGLTAPQALHDWDRAYLEASKTIISTLRATRGLIDVAPGLCDDASHVRVLRHLMAPPFSQDQFALLCPTYSKTKENRGSLLSQEEAAEISDAFNRARDRRITRWIDQGVAPSITQVRNVVRSIAPLMANQFVNTQRRNRMSAEQEGEIVDLLSVMGWTQERVGLIDQLDDVKPLHFMQKTRFATKTQPQEVDIACGLGKTVVLAMECKVTNDRTNSVKRVNDVLKKAKAWQDHWGSFVRTAALLKGVIAFKDVNRLLEANVIVFWSHDLDTFESWIEQNSVTAVGI